MIRRQYDSYYEGEWTPGIPLMGVEDNGDNIGKSPTYLLFAIVALSVIYAVIVIVLDVTGHESLVSGFTEFFIPVVMSLLTLKIELIRRQALKRTDMMESRIGARITRNGLSGGNRD